MPIFATRSTKRKGRHKEPNPLHTAKTPEEQQVLRRSGTHADAHAEPGRRGEAAWRHQIDQGGPAVSAMSR
jgi:hypothetical protein